MTDFLKIAKSIVVHFAHICAYGVETVKVALVNNSESNNNDDKVMIMITITIIIIIIIHKI